MCMAWEIVAVEKRKVSMLPSFVDPVRQTSVGDAGWPSSTAETLQLASLGGNQGCVLVRERNDLSRRRQGTVEGIGKGDWESIGQKIDIDL